MVLRRSVLLQCTCVCEIEIPYRRETFVTLSLMSCNCSVRKGNLEFSASVLNFVCEKKWSRRRKHSKRMVIRMRICKRPTTRMGSLVGIRTDAFLDFLMGVLAKMTFFSYRLHYYHHYYYLLLLLIQCYILLLLYIQFLKDSFLHPSQTPSHQHPTNSILFLIKELLYTCGKNIDANCACVLYETKIQFLK